MTKRVWVGLIVASFCGAMAFGAEVNVKAGHPKVMLTKEDIARAAKNIKAGGANWEKIKAQIADGSAAVPAYGLVYLATGDEAIGKKGVEVLMNEKTKGAEDIALGYDWLYPLLGEDQKKTLFERVSKAIEKDFADKPNSPWTNFVQRACMRVAMAGCAFTTEFPEAQKWVDKAYGDWETFHLPAVNIIAEGGGWPEGALYGYIVYSSLARLADTFSTATDKDALAETTWFADRINWWRFHTWPLPKHFYGRAFYMYAPYGDSEKWRAPMENQEIEAEFLVMRRAGETDAVKEWRWYMNQLGGPIMSPGSWPMLAYYDEAGPAKEPTALSWWAKGTGQIFVRSSWKPDATWMVFQCGPRFTYHQHLDQGQINVFKMGDLTGESGVYEPSGPSDQEGHLQGYSSRAIAHNTINIYDPDEVFSGYRSGNSPRNDGGERTWRPFSNTATTAEYWKDGFGKGAYDTGKIVEFKDDGEVVYVAMDLTGAYNSDKYVSEPNKSKVHEVTRQIVYLRPKADWRADWVFVFDRVRATDPSFEKRILWHFPNDVYVTGKETKVADGEFTYDGDLARTDTGGGRLYIRTLYPKGARINKVGGPGKEYWVFGKNFPVPDTPWESGYGQWRIEIMPPGHQTDDCFLTMLKPTDKCWRGVGAVTRLAGKGTLGGEIDFPVKFRVLFASEGPMGAVAVRDAGDSSGLLSLKSQFGDVAAIDEGSKADGVNDTQLDTAGWINLEVSDVTTEAVVKWESGSPVGYVEFGDDPEMKYIVEGRTAKHAGHSYALPYQITADLRGLKPDSRYYVRAASTGDGRAPNFSEMIEFKTPSDTTAPKISYVKVEQANPKDATISWSTDDLATGTAECTGPDQTKITAATAGAAADQRVTVEGLKPETEYTLVVTARNAGGLEAKSEPVKFKTAAIMRGYFETDFEDGKIGPFEMTKGEFWTVETDGASKKMALTLATTEGVRNLAVYTGFEYGDLDLRCKARTLEGDGNQWRDYCVVLGYEDDKNYYLVGFNSSVDVDVPGIVRIKDGKSEPIGQRMQMVTIPDRAWHDIEITRSGTKIQVFWEGRLCFEADDAAVGKGKIGFGSNNDSAAFDDIKVMPQASERPAPPEIRTKRLSIEGLVIE